MQSENVSAASSSLFQERDMKKAVLFHLHVVPFIFLSLQKNSGSSRSYLIIFSLSFSHKLRDITDEAYTEEENNINK